MRCERNRRLPARHGRRGQRREQRERHGKERASLKLRQDFALQHKIADIEQRGREGKAAIRRELAEQRERPIFRRPGRAASS